MEMGLIMEKAARKILEDMFPLVSVIMPVCNAERYNLNACVCELIE